MRPQNNLLPALNNYTPEEKLDRRYSFASNEEKMQKTEKTDIARHTSITKQLLSKVCRQKTPHKQQLSEVSLATCIKKDSSELQIYTPVSDSKPIKLDCIIRLTKSPSLQHYDGKLQIKSRHTSSIKQPALV
jgi:hypothetical protein